MKVVQLMLATEKYFCLEEPQYRTNDMKELVRTAAVDYW